VLTAAESNIGSSLTALSDTAGTQPGVSRESNGFSTAQALHAHGELNGNIRFSTLLALSFIRRAARIADDRLDATAADDTRVEADRISGISHFYLGEQDVARARLLDLFAVAPEYTFDPRSVALEALRFAHSVKLESQALERTIRREMGRTNSEPTAPRPRALAPEAPVAPPLDMRPDGNGRHPAFWLNLLPLGAGQFQEHRVVPGIAFATLQLAGVALSVYSYQKTQSLVIQGPSYFRASRGAEWWQQAKCGSTSTG
jgi:hypothetical protein